MQSKPTTQMTIFIYDAISSISTTHIGIRLLFIFHCQNVRIILEWYRFRFFSDAHSLNIKYTVGFPISDTQCLVHKCTVGMIQIPSFWYTKSGSIPLSDTQSLGHNTLLVWYSFPLYDTQSLDHKHTVCIMQFLSFWYTKYYIINIASPLSDRK